MSVSTMKKLTLLAYRADADAIVRKLMNLRCVQIQSEGAGEGLVPIDTGEVERTRAEAERRLAEIRRALPVLAKYSTRRGTLGRRVHRIDRNEFLQNGLDKAAWNTVEQTALLMEKDAALIAEKTATQQLLASLEPWQTYDAPLNALESAKTVTKLGICSAKPAPDKLCAVLEAAGAYVERVLYDEDGLYLAVTALREELAPLEQAFVEVGFLPVSFPDISTTARTAFDTAEARLEAIDAERFHIEEQLRDLSEGIDGVEILSDIEGTTVAVCEQKRKLCATKNCVVLSGWLPAAAEEIVVKSLAKFDCACEIAEPEADEEPPVLLKNGRFATTFEWVIGMYAYPKYGTYDPTRIMSIFYFIIFGMMFADVGYGLLLALGCFVGIRLLNPKLGMRRMLTMFGYCGISCMIMGVLFGGWFGNLPTAIMDSFIYHEPGKAATTAIGGFFYNGLIFNPIDSSTSFLVLALAVGEIHLIAGMAINMVETMKKGHWVQALCTTLPFWILFAGIDMMAPALVVDMFLGGAEKFSPELIASLARLSEIGKYTMFAGFGTILLFNGVGQKSFLSWLVKGLGGLYSLISLASDLLSYSRILALGLVAGVIAQVINMMTDMGAGSPIGFVFMLIVMIAGHVLNLAINLLGTFVHAARLQYIEFFGKFYEDGGEPFTPALPVEDFTESPDDVPNTIS